MANNHDVIDLTLHGGGQGFDSPRLHSKNAPEKVLLVLGVPRHEGELVTTPATIGVLLKEARRTTG